MTFLAEIQSSILDLPAEERETLLEWLSSLVKAPGRVAEPAAAYAAEVRDPMSFEEYMEFEERSPIKHEYLAGQVFAMSGVTKRHNRIAGRLYGACANHLRGGSCEPFFSDVKVRLEIGSDVYVYYPDLMVVCDPREQEDRYVANPKVIVEVLSESTARIDRHEKRLNYGLIRTLEEYAIVAQEIVQVTVFRRRENWQPDVLDSLDAALELRSIGLAVPLAQIYDGVW
ncbi:MAG TPA: Uma2 family endonuclease [Steroidobacteraceae bacterium]|jgi:Uma2 family endonuclease